MLRELIVPGVISGLALFVGSDAYASQRDGLRDGTLPQRSNEVHTVYFLADGRRDEDILAEKLSTARNTPAPDYSVYTSNLRERKGHLYKHFKRRT